MTHSDRRGTYVEQIFSRASGRRLLRGGLALAAAIACTDRASDLAVVYRGGIAAYRSLVRVQLDTGSRARVVTPVFPSGANPERVATRGDLPIVVVVLTPAGDTAARYAMAPLRLAAGTAYRLGIVIGRRPAPNRCNGAWVATAVARPLGVADDSASRPESLYVSITVADRAKESPRCDD